MKLLKPITLSLLFLTLLMFSPMLHAQSSSLSQAATAVGTVIMTVVKAIRIVALSPLVFPTAVAGDGPATVLPGTADNPNNASFEVIGEPNTAYTISLPSDGSVQMVSGAGGNDHTISVNRFNSYPTAGANGMLNGQGSQLLLVGGTRSALPLSQASGIYTGSFTISVVY